MLGLITGIAMILLVSGRALPTEPDLGLNPGEKIPSIVVGGEDISERLSNEAEAILVVWSVDDATSRAINSWISRNQQVDTDRQIPVYSICIDADQQEADLYAKLDNASPLITLWGTDGEREKQTDIKQLASLGSGRVFYTTYGMIEKSIASHELFRNIQ